MRRYRWRLLDPGRHAGVSQRSTSTLIFPGKPLTSAGKRKLQYPVFNVIINLQAGIAAELHRELDCTKPGDSSTSDLLLGSISAHRQRWLLLHQPRECHTRAS
jgi:hypothetical protein